MLDANLKTQLKGYLERLTLPVELVASLDDSAKSAELKELLQEIASLSDKVTFAEADEDMADLRAALASTEAALRRARDEMRTVRAAMLDAEARATVAEECPNPACRAPTMRFYTMQLRSADEGQTCFYDCEKCGYKFSVNT